MATATKSRAVGRVRRHTRVREKIRGSAARPRLAIYRSLTHIYGQLVDDDGGKTLVAASSLHVKDAKGNKSERAKAVGELLGQRAKAAGITEVVFDRGGYQYHGRVKALADAVRAAGVKF